MAASTMVPMAMAMPPKDMMLEFMPVWFMIMKVPSMERRRNIRTAKLKVRLRKNRAMTMMTTTDSSKSTLLRWSMDLSMRSDLS